MGPTRKRFFFYGTLMDRALLSGVLERRVSARDLVPARLQGWRRTAVKGETYPAALRCRGAVSMGLVFTRVRAGDEARLSVYEGPGYRIVAGVAQSGERRRDVRFFVPRPGAYTPVNRSWAFAAWRRRQRSPRGGSA